MRGVCSLRNLTAGNTHTEIDRQINRERKIMTVLIRAGRDGSISAPRGCWPKSKVNVNSQRPEIKYKKKDMANN